MIGSLIVGTNPALHELRRITNFEGDRLHYFIYILNM